MSRSWLNFCWSQLPWLSQCYKKQKRGAGGRKERKGKGKSRNHLKKLFRFLSAWPPFILAVVSNLPFCLVHSNLMCYHIWEMAKHLEKHAHYLHYCLKSALLQSRTLRLKKRVRGPSFNQLVRLLGFPPQYLKAASNIWLVPSHPPGPRIHWLLCLPTSPPQAIMQVSSTLN